MRLVLGAAMLAGAAYAGRRAHHEALGDDEQDDYRLKALRAFSGAARRLYAKEGQDEDSGSDEYQNELEPSCSDYEHYTSLGIESFNEAHDMELVGSPSLAVVAAQYWSMGPSVGCKTVDFDEFRLVEFP